MLQLIEFLKEKEGHDFRSKEAKSRVKEINQENDGLEIQAIEFCTVLLYGDGEEADHDAMDSSF